VSKIRVLVEVPATQPDAFAAHREALGSTRESFRQNEEAARALSGLGLEVIGDYAPVPMFSEGTVAGAEAGVGFAAFVAPTPNADAPRESVVVLADVPQAKLDDLRRRSDVRVYPSSPLSLFSPCGGARAALAGVECRPFQAGVPVPVIRDVLGIRPFHEAGFDGRGAIVGILDEGVNGATYPVSGGFARPGALQPGQADVTSHGSMCAADVAVAAPGATIHDLPFLGIPDSGGALGMFQAALEQRRQDGTPHVLNNSYGFVSVPPQAQAPTHEIWDLNHPLHRKIREVVASGAPVFFAAGNCGAECPSGRCLPSSIGPGISIHGSNALTEVITVAAVNHANQRIGYSSQGPGMFDPMKPDISAYSHFFGNFGPGRPGGLAQPFDNGTSAACPVATGVAALLLSIFGAVPPALLKQALMDSAVNVEGAGWNANTGRGVLNAIAAFEVLAAQIGGQAAAA
jgi:serine protease AprX